MPFMKDGKRDYQKEKEWDHKNGRIKDRAQRNAARSKLEKEGKVKKGDGKQVDHKRAISSGGSNSRNNLVAVPDKVNLAKEAKRKKDAAKKK